MTRSDFYYDLPEELIAQTPIEKRDNSRLLCLDKSTGKLEHTHFYDIINYLNPNDLIVMNNSRVLPSRLIGEKLESHGAMEFLLLEEKQNNVWEVLVRPGKKAKTGSKFSFGNGKLVGTVLETLENGDRIVSFEHNYSSFYECIDDIGLVPLPPYIHEALGDSERYQTVYSEILGSAAAPTAGLHFTNELIKQIHNKGIKTAFVTLHVGVGTFRPVKVDNIAEHQMHSERYFITKETADLVNKTKENGGRIVSVGTTSCRTLESAFENGKLPAKDGSTNIFIYPGYKFKCIDALITNFHLPESTLIMLVSAFAGYENTMNAYNVAVQEKYRFFSFGDAMFIH